MKILSGTLARYEYIYTDDKLTLDLRKHNEILAAMLTQALAKGIPIDAVYREYLEYLRRLGRGEI